MANKSKKAVSSAGMSFGLKAVVGAVAAIILALAAYILMNSSSTANQSPETQLAQSALADPSTPLRVLADQSSSYFVTGSPQSTKVAYVFFDPQCPHCGTYWAQLKSLSKTADVQVRWVPVGWLNQKSEVQAALLISSDTPVDLMTLHESTLRSSGGIGGPVSQKARDKAKLNTQIFNRSGAQSVPYTVFYPSLMAAPRMAPGAMTLQDFMRFVEAP